MATMNELRRDQREPCLEHETQKNSPAPSVSVTLAACMRV